MQRLILVENAIIQGAEPELQRYLRDSLDDWLAAKMPVPLSDYVTFDFGEPTGVAIHALECVYRGMVR